MRIIEYRLSSITSPWKRLIVIENMKRMKVIGWQFGMKKKKKGGKESRIGGKS